MERADVQQLVAEFKAVGLTDTDARRSAYCTLALHRGWNTARIGRFLGISRARVGQRIERLHHYTETRKDMMRLNLLLSTSAPREELTHTQDLPVGFLADQWEDADFAWGMLYQIADGQ